MTNKYDELINGFEQPRPKSAMNLVGDVHHDLRQLILMHRHPPEFRQFSLRLCAFAWAFFVRIRSYSKTFKSTRGSVRCPNRSDNVARQSRRTADRGGRRCAPTLVPSEAVCRPRSVLLQAVMAFAAATAA